MLTRLDILAGCFVSSTILFTICNDLAASSIRQTFTTVLTIDTPPYWDGDLASVDFLGRCFLGKDRISCRELTSAIMTMLSTGYESEDEHYARAQSLDALERTRVLLVSYRICEFPYIYVSIARS